MKLSILIATAFTVLSTHAWAGPEYLCNVLANTSDINRIMTTRDSFNDLHIPIYNIDNKVEQRVIAMNKLARGGVEITVKDEVSGTILLKQKINSNDNGIYYIETEGIQAVCFREN